MERRKSFMLYLSQYETIRKLNTEQKAELLDAFFSYHNGEEKVLSYIVDIVFTAFREQFKIDAAKYEKTVQRNAANGKNGWRPKSQSQGNPVGFEETQWNPKNPVGFEETQENPTKPKKPDEDEDEGEDDDKDEDEDEDLKKDNAKALSKKPKAKKPEIVEIVEIKANSFEEAEIFFEKIRTSLEEKAKIDPNIVEFFEYWTAPMKSGKQLWRSKPTFAFKARLRTWLSKRNLRDNSWLFTSNKPPR